jgi:signal transduction histidine kinase
MDQAIADIRTAIFSLHARSRGSTAGLRAQILAVAEELTPILGFAPAVRLGSGLDDHVAAGQAEHLLAVLREALSNAGRHANANNVEISVEADGELILRVTDDGVGMGSTTRRSGLANMSDRAELLGGTLTISPSDDPSGTGTILDWRIPLG